MELTVTLKCLLGCLLAPSPLRGTDPESSEYTTGTEVVVGEVVGESQRHRTKDTNSLHLVWSHQPSTVPTLL